MGEGVQWSNFGTDSGSRSEPPTFARRWWRVFCGALSRGDALMTSLGLRRSVGFDSFRLSHEARRRGGSSTIVGCGRERCGLGFGSRPVLCGRDSHDTTQPTPRACTQRDRHAHTSSHEHRLRRGDTLQRPRTMSPSRHRTWICTCTLTLGTTPYMHTRLIASIVHRRKSFCWL